VGQRAAQADEEERMIVGIDPGLAGGYAMLGNMVLVDDLPIHAAQHGAKAKVRNELDLHTFRDILAEHTIEHVFIERVAARPGQGVTSVFRFAEAAGALYGLMVGLGLPVTFVTPQIWQRHHGIGPSPDAACQRATQLYPQLAGKLAKRRDQHRADAILLASFGLHHLTGAA
jgi:crossover junction endodeoxyribonuclease RuvC